MIPASHPACVLVRDQASMNCGRSAGTVEYPAKPRISAPHIAATIAAEGPTGTELAELTAQQFRVDCRRSRRERSWLFPLHQKAAIGHPGNAPAPHRPPCCAGPASDQGEQLGHGPIVEVVVHKGTWSVCGTQCVRELPRSIAVRSPSVRHCRSSSAGSGRLLGWRSAFVVAGILSTAGVFIAWAALPRADPSVGSERQPVFAFGPVFNNRDALVLVFGYAAAIWGSIGLRQWIVVFLAFCAADQAGAPPKPGSCWRSAR